LNFQSFSIAEPIKIFTDFYEIKIEKVNNNDNIERIKLSDDEENVKLGEIIKKESKYYYKPNIRDSYYPNLEEIMENDGFYANSDYYSWLIYKGDQIPSTKNKYRVKEGDIIKLGREWLFIKEIFISDYRKKNKETNKGNKDRLFSYQSQTNKELNLNEDFILKDYNDTEEEEDDIIIVDKNKFVTENEDNRQILIKDEKKFDLNLKKKEDIEKNSNKDNESKETKNKKSQICRICYLGEYDKINNPLIKPCKCSGSMKYIHYECLLHWIKTKIKANNPIQDDNNILSTYSLCDVECELCKNKLPNYIRHKNKIYSLLNLDKKFDGNMAEKNKIKEKIKKKIKEWNYNYIIFDLISPNKSDNKYRFLAKFDKNNILKIGRGIEVQLVLNDISVSRNHCQLKLENDGSIVIEDNNSKFGTLILIQGELEILKGQKLNIQAGSNYLIIELKKKFKFFGCCNAEEIDMKNTYEKLNNKMIKYDINSEILDESITPDNSDNEEEDKNNIKQENEDLKKELIDKEEESKYIELNILDNEKNTRNKKIFKNNLDSTNIGSTIMMKENQNEDNINKKNSGSNNIKLIRNEIFDKNKDILKEIKSENIIASEGENNKSHKEIGIKSNKSEINNNSAIEIEEE
jgi:hypothetical protein